LYESTVINETDRIQLQELKALWEKYKSLVDKEVELVKSGKTEEARQLLLSDIDDIGDTLRDYFEAFVEYNTTAAKEKVDENKQVASTASTVMIVVIFVGILIAIALECLYPGLSANLSARWWKLPTGLPLETWKWMSRLKPGMN